MKAMSCPARSLRSGYRPNRVLISLGVARTWRTNALRILCSSRKPFRPRSTASRLLPDEAVARCGRRTITGRVAITLKEGRGCFAGVSTCGSVWGCPYCAGKVASERAKEVRELAEAHIRAGGEVFMAAFTMPHHRFQTAKELR